MKPPTLNIPHLKFPPFIILEGPDASGKSTLAEALCHRLKAVVLHGASMGDNDQRPANDDIMRRYHCSLLEIATRNLAMGAPVICDRLWLSHCVYGYARRATGTSTQDLVQYQEDFLAACASMGAFYIFAVDDNCVANQMKHVDQEHPRNKQQMETLLQLYKMMLGSFTERKIPCTKYEYTTDGRFLSAWLDTLRL